MTDEPLRASNESTPTLARPGILVMDVDSTLIDQEVIDELGVAAGVGGLLLVAAAWTADLRTSPGAGGRTGRPGRSERSRRWAWWAVSSWGCRKKTSNPSSEAAFFAPASTARQ